MRKKKLERKLTKAEAERDALAKSELETLQRSRRIQDDIRKDADEARRQLKRDVYLSAFGEPGRDGGLPIGRIQVRRPVGGGHGGIAPRLEIVVDGISLCELRPASVSVEHAPDGFGSPFGGGTLATIEMPLSELTIVEGRGE